MDKHTCIIALSFGDAPDPYHGISNSVLADRVIAQAQKYRVPAIAQWEIADNVAARSTVTCASIALPEGEEYIDTYQVLVEAKKIMDANGYTNAILIAHQDHFPRVLLTAKKLGIHEADIRPVSAFNIPYDWKSTQPWTRCKLFFEAREFLAMVWYSYKKYI
jgi:hypothetical protein